ncbi:cGMP-specific 3',5'-cyclic phosphodiesterase [Hypomesus transpacificus]|uniref:cGMP-specific 3',5'-cyclic phosphodiesterase n=1 Tax=Hypomesus transpacificus TaxID=137520 RepID=UPI001F0794A2|nr:cGMP-specific 3',5'-cyclic phosphodiesterase [Hypomesus transpacificus]
MPCLHSEALESMAAADGESPRASSKSGRDRSPGQVPEKDQPVVTSAGWFFSPLWSPRSKTHRWGFGKGVESDRVEAWLDDQSDFARSYLRRTSEDMLSGRMVEMALSSQSSREGHKTPCSNPHACMLLLGRRRESYPLSRPSLWISSPSRPTPQTLTPSGSRSPRTPHSPHSSRRTGPCGQGEGCGWMMGLLGGGLSMVGSVTDLCRRALLHAGEVVTAECCWLSLVRTDLDGGSGLEVVVSLPVKGSRKGDSSRSQAHLELVKGIMGYVVATGFPLNIRDVYEDPRFSVHMDQTPAYRLKSVLCVPIQNHRHKVVGAALVINKRSSGHGPCCLFTDLDEKIMSNHMGLLGMVLDNAQLYESARQEARRSQVLMDLAHLVSEEQRSLEVLLGKMAAIILPFTHAQYCTFFITKEGSTVKLADSFSHVVEMECEELGPTCQIFRRECAMTEVDSAPALKVLGSMETLNIYDVTQDPVRTLICCPIRNSKTHDVIAVCQLMAKQSRVLGEPEAFNGYDERLLEDVAVYCSLALQRGQTAYSMDRLRARLEVMKEVLSHHITPSDEEICALQKASIPSAQSLHILEFSFTDFALSDADTMQATVRMFLDLNLVQDFNIDYKNLCQWVLSVRRCYRTNVPYHNWSHGLSTAQCMFAMLMATEQLQANFSRLEVLALMIATLNHDLDHRGVGNSYIERSQQPIAQLYGHSSLEHHHYALCLFILNNPGSQILSGLSQEDYQALLAMIEEAILATDLAVFVERRAEFFALSRTGGVCWENEKHRDLLRSMLMTASDICAIAKPWPVQRKIADLVAKEFFAQGDREKHNFNIKPLAVMDRDNSTRLPHMQVDYIDSICHPLYQALSGIFTSCSPLLDGCRRNRENWQHLTEMEKEEGELE